MVISECKKAPDVIFCFYDIAKSAGFHAPDDFLYKHDFMSQLRATKLWAVEVKVVKQGDL